jgi:hypothetical protein
MGLITIESDAIFFSEGSTYTIFKVGDIIMDKNGEEYMIDKIYTEDSQGKVLRKVEIFSIMQAMMKFANGPSSLVKSNAHFLIGFLAATALILGAAYSLWMTKRVFFGAITNTHVAELLDINKREFFILSIFALLTIAMGVYPKPFTDLIHPSVIALLKHIAISKI